jgi:hypothetical protein
MTTFFIDLWHDLREKRLWPVAVGLLAAIVAVPVILFKPASEATPPSVSAPKGGPTPTLPVVTVDSGPTMGSHLEAFSASEKNPFKPMKDLAKTTGSSSSSKSSSSGSSSSGGSSGSSSSSGGSSAKPTGSGTSSSPSGGGSTSPGTGSGGTSPGNSTPTVKWFHYTADFTFGQSGKKPKTYKSTASFTLLPDETKPVVVFMGVDTDHKTALFYIADPGFTAQGEGKCNAKGAACRFVTLKVSDTADEETFSAIDGSISYDVKLTGIKREELGTGKQPNAPASPKTGKALAATGEGVAAATATTQSLLPAAFAGGPGVAREQK